VLCFSRCHVELKASRHPPCFVASFLFCVIGFSSIIRQSSFTASQLNGALFHATHHVSIDDPPENPQQDPRITFVEQLAALALEFLAIRRFLQCFLEYFGRSAVKDHIPGFFELTYAVNDWADRQAEAFQAHFHNTAEMLARERQNYSQEMLDPLVKPSWMAHDENEEWKTLRFFFFS
jgi:hypothetical protein